MRLLMFVTITLEQQVASILKLLENWKIIANICKLFEQKWQVVFYIFRNSKAPLWLSHTSSDGW